MKNEEKYIETVEKYIKMMDEDMQETMKESCIMSFRNQSTPINAPRALFYDPKYAQLSADAKCLYILMLDRLFLLTANGWFDDSETPYIYYKMKQIAADLHCTHNTANKLVTQLEDAGLITRLKAERYRPNRYYIHSLTEDNDE